MLCSNERWKISYTINEPAFNHDVHDGTKNHHPLSVENEQAAILLRNNTAVETGLNGELGWMMA